MEPEESGGGVEVEKGDLDGCALLCEEKIRCGWFSYDKSSNLCYLKFARSISIFDIIFPIKMWNYLQLKY